MKRTALALAPLTLALAATACGGSSSSSSSAAPAAGSAAAVAATSSQPSSTAAGRGAYGASSASTSAAPATSASTGAAAAAAKAPDGPAVVSTKTTKLGSILADAKGRTLYLWVADKGASSVCSGPCAQFWPPLLTKGAPTASGSAEAGLLGTSPRADGTTQVTYQGHPLYTFLKDTDRNDDYGQGSDGFGAKWWVVAPAGQAISTTPTAAAGTGTGAVVSTKTTKLGSILADAKGRTLYLWVADKGGTSVCTGQCAQYWPPLLTKGAPTASGATKASELGTTKRADGTTQVTYGGHPLYTFAKDTDRGDRYGQGSDGFGAKWWVVAPGGTAIAS